MCKETWEDCRFRVKDLLRFMWGQIVTLKSGISREGIEKRKKLKVVWPIKIKGNSRGRERDCTGL